MADRRGDIDAWFDEQEREPALPEVDVALDLDLRSPDEVAQERNIADEVGHPPQAVRAYPELFSRNAEVSRTQRATAGSPRLQRWLSTSSNYAVARDDADNLSIFESLGRAIAAPRDATSQLALDLASLNPLTAPLVLPLVAGRRGADYTGAAQGREGELDVEYGNLAFRRHQAQIGRGEFSADDQARLDELATRPNQGDWGPLIIGPTRRLLPQVVGAFERAGQGAIEGVEQNTADIGNPWDVPEGERWNARRVMEGAVGTGLYAITAPVAAFGGGVGGYLAFGNEQETGVAFDQMVRSGVEPDIAATRATEYGAWATAIEFAGEALGLRVSGVTRLATRAFLRERVLTGGTSEAVRRAAGSAAGYAADQGVEEAAQELAQIIHQDLARQETRAGSADVGAAWRSVLTPEAIQQILMAGYIGAQAGAGMAAVPASANFALDMRAIQNAERNAAVFEEMTRAAQQSALAQRLPSAFESAVSAMDDSQVYIDADRFVEHFQSAGANAYAVADELGFGGERLAEALSSHGQVTIPTSTFAARVLRLPEHAPLAQHARRSPTDATPAEIETAMEVFKAQLERVSQEADAAANVAELGAMVETRVRELFAAAEEEGSYRPEIARRYAKLAAALPQTLVARARAIDPAYADRIESQFRTLFGEGLDIAGPGRGMAGTAAELDQRPASLRSAVEQAGDGWVTVPLYRGERGPAKGLVFLTPEERIAKRYGPVSSFEVQGPIYDATDRLVMYQDKFNEIVREAKEAGARGVLIRAVDRGRLFGDQEQIVMFDPRFMRPREGAELRQDAPPAVHPTVLRFGTEEDAASLRALAESRADAEEIFAHPLMQAIDAHVLSQQQTMTPEQAADPAFLAEREYVWDGASVDYAAVLERLRAFYENAAGEAGVRAERQAVVVIGHPGAGKSTFIQVMAEAIGAAFVDADKAKEVIREYEDGFNTMAVHEEAGWLRNQVFASLVEDGANLIIERIGDTAGNLSKPIKALEAAGYTVEVVHVAVDGREAVARAALRFLAGGRYIEPSAYRRILGKPEQTFSAAVENGAISRYMEINANGPQGQHEVSRSNDADEIESAVEAARQSGRERAGPSNQEASQSSRGSAEASRGEGAGERGASGELNQTETEEFRRWFGDSKVVDEDGAPLVVYHGTTADVETFDTTSERPAGQARKNDLSYLGSWFSTSQAVANKFAVKVDAWGDVVNEEGANVLPVYLSLQNPRVFETRAPDQEKLQSIRNRIETLRKEGAEKYGSITWRAPRSMEEVADQRRIRAEQEELYSELSIESSQDALEQLMDESDQFAEYISGAKGKRGYWRKRYIKNNYRETMEKMRELLIEQGHDGVILRNTAYDADGGVDTQYVAFFPEQIKSAIGNRGTFDPNDPNILFQKEKGATRAYFETEYAPGTYPWNMRAFKPGEFGEAMIRMTEAADLSTFLHEFGHLAHYILESVATDPNAPAEFKRMWADTLAWWNVTPEQWAALDRAGRTPHLERWARTFEAYLMEGKAPALSLREAFAAFKAWLTQIYRTVFALDANLNPQIRDVFDRLLATDAELAQARAAMGGDFGLAREAFKTDEEFAAYTQALTDAREAEEGELRARVMDAYVRKEKRWWRSERARVRPTAEIEVDSDPARRAYEWLAFGEWRAPPVETDDDGAVLPPDASLAMPEDLPDMKLDPQALQEDYGEGIFNELPVGLRPLRTEDVDAALDQAMALKRQARVKQPQRLWAFIKAQGGIRDEGGEITQALGSARSRPGLINNASGLDADELALRAWEAGYFGAKPRKGAGEHFQDTEAPDAGSGGARPAVGLSAEEQARLEGGELFSDDFTSDRRPTPRELLDALIDDLKNIRQVYSSDDADAVAAYQNRADAIRWFEARSIDLSGTKEEIRSQIVDALTKEAEPGGWHADEVAPWFGFSSGDEMIQAMKALKPRAQAIEENIEARLEGQYGDPMRDGTVAEAARLAAHVEAQARKVEIELAAIQRATGGRATPVGRAAKAYAEQQIQRMTVKQVRNFDQFLAGERRAARNSLEAFKKGDMGEAALQKQRQLISFHLYRFARDAAEEMDKAQRYFQKFDRDGVRAKIHPPLIDQIDQALEGIDLRKSPRISERRRQGFLAWFNEMQAEGLEHMVMSDPEFMEQVRARPFASLTLEEARGLRDAVRNFEHIGRRWREVLAARDARLLDEEVALMAANMATVKPFELANAADHSPGVVESIDLGRQKFHAILSRVEFVAFAMDGHRYGGPVQKGLIQPMRDARGREEVRQEQAQQAIETLFSVYTNKERADMWTQRRYYPQVPNRDGTRMGRNFTKQEILALALNTGNEYNWGALLAGEAKTSGATESQIRALLDAALDKRDWEFVQSVWDYVDGFWPEIEALYLNTAGVAPPKVRPTPFTNRYGEWRGGYYHLQYDFGRDQRAREEFENGRIQEAFGGFRLRTQTPNGFAKARQGSGGRPVLLDLSVLTEHVNGVIHDLEFRVPVLNAWRMIKHSGFRDAFVRAAGQAQYDQLKPWLQYIATERMPPENIVTGSLKLLRQNTPIVLMGYSLSTVAQQPAGVLGTMHRLGAGRIIGKLAQTVAQPWTWMDMGRFVNSRSTFMRNRTRISQREIREMVAELNSESHIQSVELLINGNARQKIEAMAHLKRVMGRYALWPLAFVDKMVSSVPWLVAYEDAIAGRVENVNPQSEKEAIDYADHIIATTFGSGRPEDLPPIMRANELGKLITPAFSYFSTQYNQLYNEQLPGLMRGRISPIEFMTFIALALVVQQLISTWAAGRWDEEDEDDETRARRLGFEVAIAPFAGVPIVRDIARGVASQVATGRKPQGDLVPAFGAITSTRQAVGGTIEAIGKGEDIDRTTMRAIVMSSGYWFGLPSNALWKAGEEVSDIASGEDDLSDPWASFREATLRDTR